MKVLRAPEAAARPLLKDCDQTSLKVQLRSPTWRPYSTQTHPILGSAQTLTLKTVTSPFLKVAHILAWKLGKSRFSDFVRFFQRSQALQFFMMIWISILETSAIYPNLRLQQRHQIQYSTAHTFRSRIHPSSQNPNPTKMMIYHKIKLYLLTL